MFCIYCFWLGLMKQYSLTGILEGSTSFPLQTDFDLCLPRSPPNPLSTPPAGLSQVWADRRRLLRFCHDTGNLSLTVRQNERRDPRRGLHADILLLRERLRDADFLKEVSWPAMVAVATDVAVDLPLE